VLLGTWLASTSWSRVHPRRPRAARTCEDKMVSTVSFVRALTAHTDIHNVIPQGMTAERGVSPPRPASPPTERTSAIAGYDDTPGNRPSPFPFEIIDLTTHADSKLLQLCSEMTKLQERWDQLGAKLTSGLADCYWGTADAIAALQPKTLDGLQMKALVALDMLSNGQRKLDKIGGRASPCGEAASAS
jgi:hypothetical protein